MSTTEAGILGAVLAGGESRRFGSDKASAVVDGQSMLARAYAALSDAYEQVVVVSSRPDTPSGAWERIPDVRDACGPLGGIEAALERAEEDGLEGAFVLACDLPGVDASVIRAVTAGLDDRMAAAPGRDGDPDFEPLCAVYRVGCLPVARRLLEEGRRSARALFEEVGGARIDGLAEAFLNVNTPEDLARAAGRERGGPA